MNRLDVKILTRFSNKKTRLCVGLDPDLTKIPARFLKAENPILEFNKFIIDQTKEFAAAYKPNMAFYEAAGFKGIGALFESIRYIPPDIAVILDAKRGDIGNTSQAYAKMIFENMNADATTVAPYMGTDSIEPFLKYKNNYTFVLCLTSNPGAADFEKPELYKKVAGKITEWNKPYGNCGAVVGATNNTELTELREIMPDVNFLIPGIGAQGGDLENTIKSIKKSGSFLINSSRNIIYAENPEAEASALHEAIKKLI